jgi:hypothetical protein
MRASLYVFRLISIKPAKKSVRIIFVHSFETLVTIASDANCITTSSFVSWKPLLTWIVAYLEFLFEFLAVSPKLVLPHAISFLVAFSVFEFASF